KSAQRRLSWRIHPSANEAAASSQVMTRSCCNARTQPLCRRRRVSYGAAKRAPPAGHLPLRSDRGICFVVLCLFACSVWTIFLHAADAQRSTSSAADVKGVLQELMRMEVPTVYGASRREEKASDAPASVTI